MSEKSKTVKMASVEPMNWFHDNISVIAFVLTMSAFTSLWLFADSRVVIIILCVVMVSLSALIARHHHIRNEREERLVQRLRQMQLDLNTEEGAHVKCNERLLKTQGHRSGLFSFLEFLMEYGTDFFEWSQDRPEASEINEALENSNFLNFMDILRKLTDEFGEVHGVFMTEKRKAERMLVKAREVPSKHLALLLPVIMQLAIKTNVPQLVTSEVRCDVDWLLLRSLEAVSHHERARMALFEDLELPGYDPLMMMLTLDFDKALGVTGENLLDVSRVLGNLKRHNKGSWLEVTQNMPPMMRLRVLELSDPQA